MQVTPKASADRVLGSVEDGRGGRAIKIAVTAPAEGGKANAALVAFLARRLGLPARDIRVISGLTHRRKAVEIAGEPRHLAPLIEQRLVHG